MPPTNKAKKSGLTLPGYRYLGPFNSLFSGKPVNKADEAARKHDLGYSDLLEKGENPYLYFNEHDATLIQDLQEDRSFGGILARSVFKVKQAVAPALPGGSKGGPAKSDRAAKRKLYFARSNRGAKQQKMEDPSANNEIEPTAAEQPADMARSGGGGSMGGGGKGGAGVGYSTGGWTGGSVFTDDLVVTKNTRQFLCDIKNQHLYKIENLNAGENSVAQVAVTTPWSYFNFNQYSSHFSPHDWQHLINDYERFRPAAMRVRIYNLQIKQIVTDGAQGNLYNNDLTAGLHIMCDGDHKYPYVQHPWDDNCMPEMPNEIWKLSQYAYLQRPYANTNDAAAVASEMEFLRGAPLYILENTDHQVLRTGEATEFNFTFNCEWVENNISYLQPQMMYNPLTATRLLIRQTDPNQATKFPAALKPSNWYAGPGLLKTASNRNTANGQASGPILTRVDTNNNVANENANVASYSTWPTFGALAAGNTQRNIHYQTGEGQDQATLWYKDRHTCTREYYVNEMTNAQGALTQKTEWWMLPNQVWDSAPISRFNSIWLKVPRVNRRTMIDTQDGTIPMEHPPGTIFMKLAKIPVPGDGDSYLTIYATGQVSCEVAWEVKKRGTKNWRPEFYHTAENMNASAYTFNDQGLYTSAVEPADTMQSRYGHAKVL